jgi:hypothetical protein
LNFLHLFAQAVAASFEGTLHAHSNGYYEFLELDLLKAGLPNTLYKNNLYTFEQGAAGKIEDGTTVSFFGFGNDFFNHIVEHCRNQKFGGVASVASIAEPSFQAPVVLVTATASSVATSAEYPETYPLCAFVSAESGTEVRPELLFRNEWYPSTASSTQSATLADTQLASALDARIVKLMSYRNREFVRSTSTIEATLGVK